jgi:hypothetical protein
MPRRSSFAFALFLIVLALLPVCSAQTQSEKPFWGIGVAIKASLLGAGVEAATPLTLHSNLRAGFNMFSQLSPRIQ